VTRVLAGLAGLIGLALAMRFRLRGRYARWRMHTAYGDAGPKPGEFRRDALRVGACSRRIGKLGRHGGR